MSFCAQPVPLIQLTDTNKIINSSTATFMTRSLKKTTSPELQISPEQASNPAKPPRDEPRNDLLRSWSSKKGDQQEIDCTVQMSPHFERENNFAARALNNSSKIGQKNISFFIFPQPVANCGGRVSSFPMERFALITVGPLLSAR